MKYKAVIFDLYGTLVSNLGGTSYNDLLTQTALILSVPPNDFLKMWKETAYDRNTGVFPSVEAGLTYICQKLGIPPENTKSAAQIKQNYTRQIVINPRSDVKEVITNLRDMGYKTGLISNCGPDTPPVWMEIPIAQLIDVAIFSSSVGLMKPDPSIYQMAVEQLEVKPNECLYIADGVDQELAGAAEVGMHPVQIKVFGDESSYMGQEEWHGPRISSLTEVLSLAE
jgi:putative hydrolase of the HAD superfamily